jgi:hypothetical protein
VPRRVVLDPARAVRPRRPRVEERRADEHGAVGREHRRDLPEEAPRVGRVLDHVVRGHEVEALAAERGDVAPHEPARALDARLERQERIDAGEVAEPLHGEGAEEIARAAPHVEHARVRARPTRRTARQRSSRPKRRRTAGITPRRTAKGS